MLTGEFVALLVALLVFGMAHSAYFLLPKFLAVELHAGAAEIGWISSLTWFANVASVAFVGVWIDRRGGSCSPTSARADDLTCVGNPSVDRSASGSRSCASRTASRSRCS
jgi:MFS family permease